MSREHGPHLEPGHRVTDFLRRNTAGLELLEGPAGGAGLRVVGASPVGGSATYAVNLLGGVHEQEEQGERTCHRPGESWRECVDGLEQVLQLDVGGIWIAPIGAARAQGVDRLEDLVALEPTDDPPQDVLEPANVLVEGSVLVPHRQRFHGTILSGAGFGCMAKLLRITRHRLHRLADRAVVLRLESTPRNYPR